MHGPTTRMGEIGDFVVFESGFGHAAVEPFELLAARPFVGRTKLASCGLTTEYRPRFEGEVVGREVFDAQVEGLLQVGNPTAPGVIDGSP